MFQQEQHTMVLKEEFPDGAQEWVCPQCGRRFIMQWPPSYKRIILEQGDNTVIHAGGTGGVVMGSAGMTSDDVNDTLPGESLDLPGDESDNADDSYLAPFKHWLDANDR